MKRYLVLAAVFLVLPAVAHAKGPSAGNISGPGLGPPLSIGGDEGSGPLGTLTMQGGFFPAAFGQTPDPMLPRRPSGDLGPRYTVTYTVPGPDGGTSTIRQHLYPYAAGGPVTFMPAGQPFFDGMKTRGGWFRAAPSLTRTLVAAGLPARAQAGAASGTPFWQSPGGLALWAVMAAALLGGVAVVLRHRPRPAAA